MNDEHMTNRGTSPRRFTEPGKSIQAATAPPVAVVLAAGKGTRMKSNLPKVLIPCCDRPMIDYVLDALRASGVPRILVVVGYQADAVRAALRGGTDLTFVLQAEQLGTGHAVAACRSHFVEHDGPVVVVTGDSPLIRPESIVKLLDLYRRERPACILGTLNKDDPTGLGRIVRGSDGEFLGIVEEKDATAQQRRITEVNMSTYAFDGPELLAALDRIQNDNEQGEYYLTDAPGILKAEGKDVRALPILKPIEALSVNSLEELGIVEAEMRRSR